MTFRYCHSEGAFSVTEESLLIENVKNPCSNKKIPRRSKKTGVKFEIPPIVGMTFRYCHSEGAFSVTEESLLIENVKISC
jgi:hypothetical protein